MQIGHSTDDKKNVRKFAHAIFCSLLLLSNNVAIAAPSMPVAKDTNPQILLAQAGDRDYCINKVEENTRQILLKLIELEKYNLNYHLNVAKQGRWKGWRYFLSQEANNSLGLSGCIVGTVERGSSLQHPKQLHRNTLELGNYLSLTGQTIGAAGSCLELLINKYHDIEAHKKGFGPKEAKEKVLALRHDLDKLLLEREKLLVNLQAVCNNNKYVELAKAEEPVLRDMRDISLDEFKQFHLNLRRAYAFQQSLYLLDIARNTVGACGNRYGWRALKTGNRYNNATAGILFDISGLITIFNPFISRGVGILAEKYEKRRIKDIMDGVDPGDVEKLAVDLDRVQAIANTPELERTDLPLLRAALYEQHEVGVRKQVHLKETQLRAGVLTAAENMVSGTFIGGTKIGAGVLFNICGNKFVYNAKRTNIYLATANIIGTVGTGYALLETARIQVKREMQYQKGKKEKTLPGQIMKERLAQLDDMEKSLSAPVPISFHPQLPEDGQDFNPDMRM